MYVKKVVARAKSLLLYRWIFCHFGSGSFLIKPLAIHNPRYISIGNNVRVRDHIRLEAIDKNRHPELTIGDNCNIEQNVHIVCSGRVTIGRDCSITANCSIVDTSHPYDLNDDRKIGDGLNIELQQVLIGDGCFIGMGAVILPNVILGKGCVIGANSVVTAGTYPDRSVLAGVPARLLRRY